MICRAMFHQGGTRWISLDVVTWICRKPIVIVDREDIPTHVV